MPLFESPDLATGLCCCRRIHDAPNVTDLQWWDPTVWQDRRLQSRLQPKDICQPGGQGAQWPVVLP